MALPRSTVPGAVVKTTGQKFTVATPTSIAAGAVGSVAITTLSSRKFSPGEQTVAWYDLTDGGGGLILVGAGPVTGNKPLYTTQVTFANPTGSAITTRSAVIWLAQE